MLNTRRGRSLPRRSKPAEGAARGAFSSRGPARGSARGSAAASPLLTLILLLAPAIAGADERAPEAAERQQIAAVLDDFHAAAAAADLERYLGHFAPEGVFLGTDDWERWPLAVFREYTAGRFAGGGGWSYSARDRNIVFSPDSTIAWFDEIAESARWGRFRGTGVLRMIDGRWKIAQYSLSLLVPNESFEPVASAALDGFRKREEQ